MRFGADEEDRPRGAGLDETAHDLQAEEHRRALLADVERGHALQPQLVREQPARTGKDVVRRHRREDDVVDLFGADPRGRDGAPARLERESLTPTPSGA